MSEQNKVTLDELPPSVRSHIEHLERVRRDFVANVSHELRTPLTVIRGYLESLLQQDSQKGVDLKKIFSQMYQHSVRMENIIEDLLLLSHLEGEEQEQELQKNINVAEVLQSLYEDAQSISADKKHQITLQADPQVVIDGNEDELKSLFSNLIINAVKYTPAHGNIEITWGLENGRGVFRVSDTGIGIAKQHIPRITERFYRVDKGRSRASGGTGLGLAIAKHVLLRHQGEIEIKSELNQGSTFTCCFPQNRTSVIKLS